MHVIWSKNSFEFVMVYTLCVEEHYLKERYVVIGTQYQALVFFVLQIQKLYDNIVSNDQEYAVKHH